MSRKQLFVFVETAPNSSESKTELILLGEKRMDINIQVILSIVLIVGTLPTKSSTKPAGATIWRLCHSHSFTQSITFTSMFVFDCN